MINFVVNENITLNMLQHEDAEVLFKLVDDNWKYLRKWLPWLDMNTSRQDSEYFIQSTHKQLHDNLGFMCGIYFQHQLVGMCGYHPLDKVNHSVVIGYWTAQNAQGKGGYIGA